MSKPYRDPRRLSTLLAYSAEDLAGYPHGELLAFLEALVDASLNGTGHGMSQAERQLPVVRAEILRRMGGIDRAA